MVNPTNLDVPQDSFRLRKPIIEFSSSESTLHALVSESGLERASYPWATRMLGKFPIPKWQRPLVWTQKHNMDFIESIFQGYDLGSVMINGWIACDNDIMLPMSDILIDGQQRINAVIQFTSNAFPYDGFYWSEFTRREQRVFLESRIGMKKTHCFDETILKKVYNHLNFSGVAHKPSEVAG